MSFQIKLLLTEKGGISDEEREILDEVAEREMNDGNPFNEVDVDEDVVCHSISNVRLLQ